MPVVTRADCSKLEWNGDFVFRHTFLPLTENTIILDGPVEINVVECDGANGEANDLGMYYEKLFLEGKVNDTQRAIFHETLIGGNDCSTAMRDLMEGYAPSYTSSDSSSEMETHVVCGAHTAPSCAECPMGNGPSWCDGQCQWNDNTNICEERPASYVVCGGHTAPTCALCGNDSSSCNGECHWNSATETCEHLFDTFMTASNAPS
jgi:hypothetical protein